jgi:hypothetical protein
MRELCNRFSFDRTRHLVSVDGEPNGSPTAFGKEAMTMLHATNGSGLPTNGQEGNGRGAGPPADSAILCRER